MRQWCDYDECIWRYFQVVIILNKSVEATRSRTSIYTDYLSTTPRPHFRACSNRMRFRPAFWDATERLRRNSSLTFHVSQEVDAALLEIMLPVEFGSSSFETRPARMGCAMSVLPIVGPTCTVGPASCRCSTQLFNFKFTAAVQLCSSSSGSKQMASYQGDPQGMENGRMQIIDRALSLCALFFCSCDYPCSMEMQHPCLLDSQSNLTRLEH